MAGVALAEIGCGDAALGPHGKDVLGEVLGIPLLARRHARVDGELEIAAQIDHAFHLVKRPVGRMPPHMGAHHLVEPDPACPFENGKHLLGADVAGADHEARFGRQFENLAGLGQELSAVVEQAYRLHLGFRYLADAVVLDPRVGRHAEVPDVVGGMDRRQPHDLGVEADRRPHRQRIHPTDGVVEAQAAEQMNAGHDPAHQLDAVGIDEEDAFGNDATVPGIPCLPRHIDVVEGPVQQARPGMEVHVDDTPHQVPVRLRNRHGHGWLDLPSISRDVSSFRKETTFYTLGSNRVKARQGSRKRPPFPWERSSPSPPTSAARAPSRVFRRENPNIPVAHRIDKILPFYPSHSGTMEGLVFEKKTFEAGTTILEEGKSGDAAYLIAKGRVEVRKGIRGESPQVLATLGAASVFGEMAMFDDHPNMATIVAIDKTEVIAISREEFRAKVDEMDPVIKGVVLQLVGRARQMADSLMEKNDVNWAKWKIS